MGLLFTLVVGALVGWLASIIMKTNAQQGALWNIGLGVVGAGVSGWLFGDVLGIGSAMSFGSVSFQPLSIVWAVAGACVCIGALKFLRVLR